MSSLQRETIQTHYLRVTLEEDWWGRGYRLAHVKTRTPVVNGKDTWVPDYIWPFPMDSLSEQEAKDVIAEYSTKAQDRYEEKCDQIKRMHESMDRRTEEHEEPPLGGTLRTERHNGKTMCWVESR